MRRLRCDVFHCHNVHTSPLIGAALAGVPVRIWSKLAMSPYYERGVEPTGLHRFALSTRASCRMAHRVLALSDAVRDELLQCGIPPEKVAVEIAPVELERYAAASGSGVRASLGLEPSDRIITTVGRADAVKGWDLLIEAFAGVGYGAGHLHLLLAGGVDGPGEREYAAQLKDQAARLRVADRVHFLGRRRDVANLLKASDVFAFPSRSEGQGLALVEALAAGLPCVATATGGIPGIVTDRCNGLLVPREDVDALRGALERLVQDGELRRCLASQAVQSVDRFGMGASVERHMAHYLSLLQRRESVVGRPAREMEKVP